jgi:hypothetical protein
MILAFEQTHRHQENLRLTMNETTPYLPGLSPVVGKEFLVRFDGGRLSSDDCRRCYESVIDLEMCCVTFSASREWTVLAVNRFDRTTHLAEIGLLSTRSCSSEAHSNSDNGGGQISHTKSLTENIRNG